MMVDRSGFWWRWFAPMLFISIGLTGTFFLSELGFKHIIEMRQLERLPTKTPSQVTMAESAVKGIATLHPTESKPQKSPHFNIQSLYYRFLHERKERCGDHWCWRIIENKTYFTLFNLREPITGHSVLVKPTGTIDWEIAKSHSITQGKNRYTEWRLEPHDETFVVGYTRWTNGPITDAKESSSQLQPTIDVGTNGDYPPLITNKGRHYIQSEIGGAGAHLLAASLGTLCLSIFGFVLLFRIHRMLVFLILCSFIMTLYLVNQSLKMIHLDTVNGIKRYNQALDQSNSLFKRYMNPEWEGFENDIHTIQHHFLQASPTQKALYETFKFQLGVSHARLMHQAVRVPEKWLIGLWNVSVPKSPALSESEQSLIQSQSSTFKAPPLKHPYVWFVLIGSFVLTILLSYRGIKLIKHKRRVENIGTTPTAGIVPGIAELIGTAVIREQQHAVKSKLCGLDCVWFHYIEEEKVSSGNKTRWQTVEDLTQHCLHQIEDQEGRLTVNPNEAEIFTKHVKKMRRGKRRFTERWISVGDPLYALGPIRFKTEENDARLVMEDNAEDYFILSNHTQNTIMQGLTFSGFAAMTFAMGSANFTFFTLNAYWGAFSALDFLFSSLIIPVYFLFVMFMLHYNDLIFLRKMVHRNKANIDVSLQKRKELLFNLERLAIMHMQHEKELHTRITELCSSWKRLKNADTHAIHQFVEAERAITQQTLFRLEDYPELKTSTAVKTLMRRFTVMETEIVLLRQAYNEAVKIYNTRINSVPDILYKKWLGFDTLPLINECRLQTKG